MSLITAHMSAPSPPPSGQAVFVPAASGAPATGVEVTEVAVAQTDEPWHPCGGSHQQISEEEMKYYQEAGKRLSDAYAKAYAEGTLDQLQGPGFLERTIDWIASWFLPKRQGLIVGAAAPQFQERPDSEERQ